MPSKIYVSNNRQSEKKLKYFYEENLIGVFYCSVPNLEVYDFLSSHPLLG